MKKTTLSPVVPSAPRARSEKGQAIAVRVLETEASALSALAASIDDRFDAALAILLKTKGRVIITGMGKSGHVARKIAATMASTGTPALFVHPGEASHGDLGMVTTKDAVLALSNSGNAPELGDIIAFTRRYSIPLIAITAKAKSALGRAADIVLELPPAPEACPHGLAPTSSTTMTLALGDALAVALLEKRNFTAADFRVFHPGGQLGKKLLKVQDLMHDGKDLPLIADTARMDEALLVMSEKTFGCVGVVGKDGLLAGVITDGDLRRSMSDGLLKRRVTEVMTQAPKTTRPDALAAEAVGRMNEFKITSLFVVKDGKPVGLVRMHDCLRAGVG
jgi:arabinose-5-phosphate isomerase